MSSDNTNSGSDISKSIEESCETTTKDNFPVVSSKDLGELAKKLPIESTVRVSDRGFQPHILLKNVNDEPYWRPYNYEPIEEVRIIHKWELDGQRMFQDKARSSAELRKLQQVLMATVLVNEFYELETLDCEMLPMMLQTLVTKIGLEWYQEDNGKDKEPSDEEIAPYFTLVTEYINSYVATKNGAVVTSRQLAESMKRNEKDKMFAIM